MPFPSEISLESWVVWTFSGQKYLLTFVILKLFKNLFVSPSSSVIRLSIPPCQSCIIFPVFNSFCEMQLSSISFGLFNRRTIKCLSREKSDTSVLKYLTLKINELSSKLRRLHQISLPFIARFEKFSSYACDVHPKFAHLQ